ncbi:hypothetical protein EBB07_18495 [Paenibacillaceae bacterium]|nr:hypothetical protein EBB07_18495 [Paenibacillaceae bacterium]
MSEELSGSGKRDWFQFHFSSVKVMGEDDVIAAPMGQGVLRKHKSEEWKKLCDGLPEGTHVNRLHMSGEELLACTNNGLFRLQDQHWQESELAIGCYQYKQVGRLSLAATQYGLWSSIGGAWSKTAYAESVVYDFLYLPHFIVLALDKGIAIYDRFTDSWMDYSFDSAVTSLAVYKGHVLAVTEYGHLLHSNKKGGFESVHFDNMFLFSIVSKPNGIFLCSNRGLYRLNMMNGSVSLISVKLGCPVTDMDSDGESFYLATLFEGVQTMGQ